MKARTAQQFAEADESMTSNSSPLLQHTARKHARDAPKAHHGDLTSRLLGATDDDADMTTDFRNLVHDDASLLLEGDTPDISQLMAQTPMKLASSGNWDRPPAATQVRPQPAPAKPQHVPLASLRMRGVGTRPAPPRTPPRREEESFDETLPAGYTFEAGDRDESLDEPRYDGDTTAMLFDAPVISPAPVMEEPSGSPPAASTSDADKPVDDEPEEVVQDEEKSEADAIGMKLFTVSDDMLVWTTRSFPSDETVDTYWGRIEPWQQL